MAFLDAYHDGESAAMAELDRRRTELRERIEAFRPADQAIAEDDQLDVDFHDIVVPDPRDQGNASPRQLTVGANLTFTQRGCSIGLYGDKPDDPESMLGEINYWDYMPPTINIRMPADNQTNFSWASSDAEMLMRITESALDQQTKIES